MANDVANRKRALIPAEQDLLAVELIASQAGAAAESAWHLVQAAAALAPQLERDNVRQVFTSAEAGPGDLIATGDDDARAVLAWEPASGWQSLLSAGDQRSGLLELYLPICSATAARPVTIGHLGQSLDGFIATRSGDSKFVTGDDNMVHMHRLRALCDVIVVGAGTVVADDPQLTTRRVEGRNPLRAIVDPQRRVPASARVLVDNAAPTLYFCGRSQLAAGETRVGDAVVVPLEERPDGGANVAEVLQHLNERGCGRVFVEGGGVTVSAFLEANLLDRLQITVAPMLIGDGRPAIRLTPPVSLRDCLRPSCRVFRMGHDILFDCDLRSEGSSNDDGAFPIARVI